MKFVSTILFWLKLSKSPETTKKTIDPAIGISSLKFFLNDLIIDKMITTTNNAIKEALDCIWNILIKKKNIKIRLQIIFTLDFEDAKRNKNGNLITKENAVTLIL
tara:strand:+ start:900 stop:1214 length:315 start_codon:yes stop_codon:yes gene_type:complete